MPFPPNFDRTWDISAPVDTSAANLLGQVIRNLKDDIMQRMSLLSGKLTNRPTPETVNAVWGGAGFGLIYFSTDTAQLFQWNGVAWVEITSVIATPHFALKNVVPVTSDTIGGGVLQTVTVAANTLAAGMVLFFDCCGTYIRQTVQQSFVVSLDTVVLAFDGPGTPVSGTTYSWGIRGIVLVTAAGVGGSVAPPFALSAFGSYASGCGYATTAQPIDTTVAHTLEVSVNNGVGDRATQNFLGLRTEQ
jgi:hypothetical protein